MRYIIAIDDTDDADSIGTGEHLENILELLKEKKLADCKRVTRHQLFFSPRIKYTSHNSSMAAIIELTNEQVEETVYQLAKEYLIKNAALGSDPGLCLLNLDRLSDEQKSILVSYGKRVKTEYIEKEEAISLAADNHIRLSQLGGDGSGIIGALAGASLRIFGNDGRYKGKFELGHNADNMIVRDILTHPNIDMIMTSDGQKLKDDDIVWIVSKIKTVNINNQSVLLVKKIRDDYVNLANEELKKY